MTTQQIRRIERLEAHAGPDEGAGVVVLMPGDVMPPDVAGRRVIQVRFLAAVNGRPAMGRNDVHGN